MKESHFSNRFIAFPEVTTEAVFSLDDDIGTLSVDEIEFAYQVPQLITAQLSKLVVFYGPIILLMWSFIFHSDGGVRGTGWEWLYLMKDIYLPLVVLLPPFFLTSSKQFLHDCQRRVIYCR